jgi:iron complex outermembrane receptor protein
MHRYVTRILLGALAAVLLAFPAHAQKATLTGQVTDTNGEPLPGANVVLLDSDYGTAVGSDGSYAISGIDPGTYTARVTFVGYKTIEEEIAFESGEEVTRDFTMERAALRGEGITVTVGSRDRDVAAEDLAVPVDVYSAEELEVSGSFETGRILEQIAPSVNFPQQTLADGMDALRSFTLRGLSPDQTLVLINGKRRHKSALVNRLGAGVQGGSSPVDLNAIPANAIKRMEVLRDGASSQYGSDAIAGVVNVQLKNEPLDPTVETRIGGYVTDPYPNDGTTYSVRPSFGVPLGEDGYLNFFGEYRLRTPTNRAGPSGSNPDFGFPWPLSGPTDRVADTDDDGFYEVVERNRTVEQPNFHWGDGRSENVLMWVNGAYPVANVDAEQPTEIYAFGGYSWRKGTGQGFYRPLRDDNNWPQIYPEGFLPNFETPINDYSASIGLRGMVGEWFYDVNAQTGFNDFQYNITNSLNATYGPSLQNNQTEFYAGSVKFRQSHLQVDVDRGYDFGFASPLNVAVGAILRADTYIIDAGEEASYADGPWEISQNGGIPEFGAQVFPGFRPSQEVDETRTNVGTYVDLETDLVESLRVNVAGRLERYSDFGFTLNGKTAVRFEPADELAFRATSQTGFRAPNQAQKFFSKVSTTFIDNRPFQTGIFPVNSDVGNALGVPDLKEERSYNLSGGIILKPIERLQISADYFSIWIEDRIILSGNLSGSAVRDALSGTGATVASVFSNAIDTRTQGIDATAKYAALLGDGVQLQLRGAFNWTDNEITGGPRNPTRLEQDFDEQIFGREARLGLTESSPATTVKASATLTAGPVDVTLRGSRHGEVLVPDTEPGPDEYTLSPEYEFGGEVGYSAFNDQLTLAVGARNIFDNYPDRPPIVNDPFDVILPYARSSPIGFNGRFVYSRLTVSF